MLHSVTGGWEVSIGLLLLLVVPQVVSGLPAARPGFVRPGTTRPESHGEPAEICAGPTRTDRSH